MPKRCNRRAAYFIEYSIYRTPIDRLIDELSEKHGDARTLSELPQHELFTEHVDLGRMKDKLFEAVIHFDYNPHNEDIDRTTTLIDYAGKIQSVTNKGGKNANYVDYVDIALSHINSIDLNLRARTLSLFTENLHFTFTFRAPSDVVGYLLMLESTVNSVLQEAPTRPGDNATFTVRYASDGQTPRLPLLIRYKQRTPMLPNGRREKTIADHHKWTKVSLFPPLTDTTSPSIRRPIPTKIAMRCHSSYFIRYEENRTPIDRLIDELARKHGDAKALSELPGHELFTDHVDFERMKDKPLAAEIHVDYNRHNEDIDRKVTLIDYAGRVQSVELHHKSRYSMYVDIPLPYINSIDLNLRAPSLCLFTENVSYTLTFRVPSDVVGYLLMLESTVNNVLQEAPTRPGDNATFTFRYASNDQIPRLPLVIRYKQRREGSRNGCREKIIGDHHNWTNVSLFGPLSSD